MCSDKVSRDAYLFFNKHFVYLFYIRIMIDVRLLTSFTLRKRYNEIHRLVLSISIFGLRTWQCRPPEKYTFNPMPRTVAFDVSFALFLHDHVRVSSTRLSAKYIKPCRSRCFQWYTISSRHWKHLYIGYLFKQTDDLKYPLYEMFHVVLFSSVTFNLI